MKKYIVFLLLLITTVAGFAQSGTYNNRTNSNLYNLRNKFSYLHIDSRNGNIADPFDSATVDIYYDSANHSLKYDIHGSFFTISGGSAFDSTSLSNRINACVLIANLPTILSPYLQTSSADSLMTALGYLKAAIQNAQLAHSAIFFQNSFGLNWSGGGVGSLGNNSTATLDTSLMSTVSRLLDSITAVKALITSGAGNSDTTLRGHTIPIPSVGCLIWNGSAFVWAYPGIQNILTANNNAGGLSITNLVLDASLNTISNIPKVDSVTYIPGKDSGYYWINNIKHGFVYNDNGTDTTMQINGASVSYSGKTKTFTINGFVPTTQRITDSTANSNALLSKRNTNDTARGTSTSTVTQQQRVYDSTLMRGLLTSLTTGKVDSLTFVPGKDSGYQWRNGTKTGFIYYDNSSGGGGSVTLPAGSIAVGGSNNIINNTATGKPQFDSASRTVTNIDSIIKLKYIRYSNMGLGSTYDRIGNDTGHVQGYFADTYDGNYINPDGSHDQVRRWCYNLNGGGGILDPSLDNFGAGLSLESKYNGTIGPYQSEFHYQVVTTSGLQERLWSYLTDRNSGYTYKYNLLDQEDWFTTVTGPSGTPYMSVYPSAGYFKLAMPSMGFSLQETTGSNAFSISPQSDGSVNIANNSLGTTPGPMGIYTGSGDFSFKGLVSGTPATLYHFIPNGTGAGSFLATPRLDIYSSGVDFGNAEFSLNTSGAIYNVIQGNGSSGITTINNNGNYMQYYPASAGNWAQVFTVGGMSTVAYAVKNGTNDFTVGTGTDTYGALQSSSTTQSQLGLFYGSGSGKQAFANVNSDGSLTLITQPVNKIELGGGYPFILPTAQVQIPAGVATAGGAPLKLTVASAALLTTPESGAIEALVDTAYYTGSAAVCRRFMLSNSASSNGKHPFGNSTGTWTTGSFVLQNGLIEKPGNGTDTLGLGAINTLSLTHGAVSATLSSGTVTVSDATITTNSQVVISYKAGTALSIGVGNISTMFYVPTVTAGTSFVIQALLPTGTVNTTDNSTVQYTIIN